jgi:hypothetical protein
MMTTQRFIVVDENKMPMAFEQEQFCYCDDERWEDEKFPCKVYTKATAKKLIEKSTSYRKRNGFGDTKYFLMPIDIS